MNRLPLYLGLCFIAGWAIPTALDSDLDIFGSRAAKELAKARVEIGLARAEHRAALREIEKVKVDHRKLFAVIEEAFYASHSATRERKTEKAVPPMGGRPRR